MELNVKNGIYRFLYKKDKPKALKLAGVVLVVASIGLLATKAMIGSVLLLVAIGLLAWQPGIELNFEERKYRIINSLGPIALGDWLALSSLKCISVFRTHVVSSAYSRSGRSTHSTEAIVQVNLVTEGNERIKLYDTLVEGEAFNFAKVIAEKLELQIWDATTKDQKWWETN